MFTHVTHVPSGTVYRIVEVNRKTVILADSFGSYSHRVKGLTDNADWIWS